MHRAIKLNISKFATKKKLRKLDALYEAYQGAVNFYIESMWNKRGKLDKETFDRLKNTRLSKRFMSQALKQALEIVVFTKKSAKALKHQASQPYFTGSMMLDKRFVIIEQGRNTFDLWIKLSTLKKGKRICLPTRKTAVLNKWLARPLAELAEGACLKRDSNGNWFIILWVKFPDLAEKSVGDIIGCDIGYNKFLALSNGVTFGNDIKRLSKKSANKTSGSKAKGRAKAEIKNYINRQLKFLPFAVMQTLVIEDLRGIKNGKKRNRSKEFRRNLSPWAVGYTQKRIEMLTKENRVHLRLVDPYKSSQRCSQCDCVDRKNRCGDRFLCIRCNHTEDADINAAKNHRTRFLGSLKSPSPEDTKHDMILEL